MQSQAHKSRMFNQKSQYSLLFDGVNEYVETNIAPVSGTPATFSAWIKLNALNAIQRVVSINAKATTANVLSLFIDASNKANAQQWDTDGALAVSTTVLTTGVWYHVAAVFTSDSSRTIYINGVAENTNTTAQSAMSGLNYTSMGYLAWTTNIQFLSGSIDEVAIFNTNLTAAQVLEIYNGGTRINLNAHSKAANLVAYWRLGDPTALHDGTNFQIPSSKSDLGNKKSVLFDGVNERVTIDSVGTALATTTQGTWSCWVKPVSATPTASASFITFANGDTTDAISFIHVLTSGILRINIVDGGTAKSTIDTNATPFASNIWTHIAVVQDGVKCVLYANGVVPAQTNTVSTDNTLWFNGLVMNNGRIGNRLYTASEADYFNGNIDEVRFYNTALTAAQITALYNLGNPAEALNSLTDANLVSHFRLGDAPTDSATVLEDVFGSNDGVGVNLELADLEYDAPLLATSVNMEAGDLVAGANL